MGKRWKKTVTILLILAVIVTSVNIPGVKTEAATPKVLAAGTLYLGGPVEKKKWNMGENNSWAKKCTWKSSKKAVATVTKKGVVTAKKKGTTVITATYKNTLYLRGIVKVKAYRYATGFTLDPGSISLQEYGWKKITVNYIGNPTTKGVTFTSNNVKVATVSASGYVDAKKPGVAVITVKTKKNVSKKILEKTVRVTVIGDEEEENPVAPTKSPEVTQAPAEATETPAVTSIPRPEPTQDAQPTPVSTSVLADITKGVGVIKNATALQENWGYPEYIIEDELALPSEIKNRNSMKGVKIHVNVTVLSYSGNGVPTVRLYAMTSDWTDWDDGGSMTVLEAGKSYDLSMDLSAYQNAGGSTLGVVRLRLDGEYGDKFSYIINSAQITGPQQYILPEATYVVQATTAPIATSTPRPTAAPVATSTARPTVTPIAINTPAPTMEASTPQPTSTPANVPVSETNIFSGGDGSEAAPYLVENLEQLKAVSQYPEASFKQIKDISLGYSSLEPLFSEKNPFKGTYDGDSHCISELNFNNSEKEGYSIFGELGENAKLINLNLRDCVVTSKAGCVLVWKNNGLIENCALEELVVTVSAKNTSFLCATNNGTIRRCVVSGSLVFRVYDNIGCGGIAGKNDGNIYNCTVNGTIKGTHADGGVGNDLYIGGIAGFNNGLIKGGVENMHISAEILYYGTAYGGSISGWNNGQIIGYTISGNNPGIVGGGNGTVVE